MEVAVPRPRIRIRPDRGWFDFDLAEIWHYRELLWGLACRDIKVRYKQTILGAGWAILQPLALMLMFLIVMGRMIGVPTPSGVPQPLFFFTGVLLWNLFATALAQVSSSVLRANQMVEKVYFPRIVIPLSAAFAAMLDFAVAFAFLLLVMLCYGVVPGAAVTAVPLLLLLTMFTAIGVGLVLAALNVSYRDFRHTVPLLLQVWMFATPTIYMDASSGRQPHDAGQGATLSAPQVEATRGPADGNLDSVGDWLEFNPLTPLVAAFRGAVIGTHIPWRSVAYSAAVATAMLAAGCLYFNRAQRRFADVI